MSDAAIAATRLTGAWKAAPVATRALSTPRGMPPRRLSAALADRTYCLSRAEAQRSYVAINAFGNEVFRVTGSLPFCVDPLRMRISSYENYSGKVVVKNWAESFVLTQERTKIVPAHYVKWNGDAKGSVAGRSEHLVAFVAPFVNIVGLNCPKIKIRALGDVSIKSPGNATGGC
ncbi:hypothetical protein GHK92_15840 [Nocardioides sp. dk4132]|uniref:hypothetical protein n=1 Tax=unclassified Nocardioides TaxID=2615069 RepID=UPI001296FECF|nr:MULTISPECIES: hypothetical protein [unclassified Nocardioides]MQW77346.1 hypothetical protein [Nocardioides sp. dk4132]QGA08097.1 hypothetical protein GFH29_12310 [Nocardioides sp. dk884]